MKQLPPPPPPPLQWTLSNICFIGYQWCDNSVIYIIFLSQGGVHVLGILFFLRRKQCVT